ncbi:sodium channel, voltage-gated, type I, beta a isoform X2 [Festucalex cinctus]
MDTEAFGEAITEILLLFHLLLFLFFVLTHSITSKTLKSWFFFFTFGKTSCRFTPFFFVYLNVSDNMSALAEATLTFILISLALLVALQVGACTAACVEVDSDTEAVANRGFKLGCISCKRRGEVMATASVTWLFKAVGDTDYSHLYSYEDQHGWIVDDRFEARVQWRGSRHTLDLQDGSIYIVNITYNDTGSYKCVFSRVLVYNDYSFHTNTSKTIHVRVVPKMTRGMASILSEVMMYVAIIGLQLWLLVEMIYCYRKISAAGEEALRESAAEYLAVASENKDNCAAVQVAE